MRHLRGGGDYVEPNVSLIEDGYVVMFNPKTILPDSIARLICYGSGTKYFLSPGFTGMAYIEEMTIDGVQVTPVMSYDFETAGEHTVEIKVSRDITSMNYMFAECYDLNGFNSSGLYTGNVTNMSTMFAGCSGLEFVDGIKDWDTSNVTDMTYLFGSCSGLTSVDLTGWDTSNVENMNGMFYGCTGLKSIDGIKDWDTSSVTNMAQMFCGCSGLTSVDLTGWDTSSVTNMSEMFDGCSGLTSVDLTGWDTSNVTGMREMFCFCSGLTSVDLTGWDTSKVTNMQGMFAACSGLTELRMGGNPSKVTNTSGMFDEISAKGTFYYNSAYDYSNILSALPSRWSAIACELVDGVLIPLPA